MGAMSRYQRFKGDLNTLYVHSNHNVPNLTLKRPKA